TSMSSLRHPKSVVAAAIVFCALVGALPSSGGRLARDTGHHRVLVAKVLCVETRGGRETRGDVKARKHRCAPGERRISFPRGKRGKRGFTGAAGPAGPGGAHGSTGPAGPQGVPGVAGPRGATGLAGPIGQRGATGLAGPVGQQGPTGERGATGAQGE